MYENIVLKIPSETASHTMVRHLIDDIGSTLSLTKGDIHALKESVEELIDNAITHAYKDGRGYIEVSFHPFKTGIRIDVRDWGIPMSYKKHTSVPIIKEASKGFNRIYDLVDLFEYHNLGKEGKKFVIIKYASHSVCDREDRPSSSFFSSEKKKHEHIDSNIPVTVREFREGDEEGIAYLIYKNYGHSYIKDLFYYPQKILEYHSQKFYSIVAEAEGRVIGHFAFMLIPDSTIAEIGIVVVDPRFKGRGIMNQMMDLLLKKAESIGLDAVFGEAIMYHTFSQKSNLGHGFAESALLFGKMPMDIRIESNELTKRDKRGAVLIGYRFFNKYPKVLYLPAPYKKKIRETYKNAGISLKENKKTAAGKIPKHIFMAYEFDPLSNIAKIRIDGYSKDFKHQFRHLVSQLKSKHCDMIYVDVSLENIPQIDKAVKVINKKGFFYCGVVFLAHEQTDYLRLQLKHSDKIGTGNYLCYSKFCKALSAYILEDEKRVEG
ncbi:MAG: GNAT family N-acetyltransferase [Sulfurimonas sp.]